MRSRWIGIGIALLCLTLNARPADAGEQKLGYVDLQRALNSCEAGQKAKEFFAGKVKDIQTVLQTQEQELQSLREEIDTQLLVLTEDALMDKQREYEVKLREFKRLYKDSQEDLQHKDLELTKKILLEMTNIVAAMGKDMGYTMVLEKTESSVLYAVDDPAVDLTEELIRRYNENKLQK